MASLIILTSCKSKEYLRGALESLSEEKNDILIIDDGSKVDYSEFKDRCNIIQKTKGLGVTHSWNIGYKYFKDNGYEYCLISNDDVLFPSRVPEDMWKGLEEYILIGPLSDPVGSGRFMGEYQNITSYLGGIDDFTDSNGIQMRLQRKHPNKRFLEIGKDVSLPREEPPYINGFCFSFNRDVSKAEYDKDILFNPSKVNAGNEKELQRYRLKDGKAISIKSYIYHYKGKTIPYYTNRQEPFNK